VAASSQSLTAPDHADFTFTTAFSVGTWFYRDLDSGGAEGLVVQYDDASAPSRAFLLFIQGDDTIAFNVITSSGPVAPIGPKVSTGRWYYAVGTYDGVTERLYLNGVEVATGANTGDIAASTEPLTIGARSSSGVPVSFFDGRIWGAFLSSTVMTQEQITDAYLRGKAMIESPVSGVLPAADVDYVETDGQYVYMGNQDSVEVRNVSGAVVKRYGSASTGNIVAVAPWPSVTDSVGLIFGGSAGIRQITPDPLAVDLALASYAPTFKGIGSGPAVVDSAGNGHFWTDTDALNAISNVSPLVSGIVYKGGSRNGATFTEMSTHTQPVELVMSPKVSGTGTADTVAVYRGAVTGLTDDNTVIIASGLDTSKSYFLAVDYLLNGATTEAKRHQIAIAWSDPSTPYNQDIDMCSGSACEQVFWDVDGTRGSDGKYVIGMYLSGSTGVIEIENRRGSPLDLMWELISGGG
jgi:hypothetical protein